MNSSIKKATKRRAMRVVTVFTGAAACATAFAPAAMAGTDHVARLTTPANSPHRFYGSIRSAGCANVPHWVHIQAMVSEDRAFQRTMRCFGYDGLLQVSSNHGWGGHMLTYYECGGNNSGVLIVSNQPPGQYGANQPFGPGKTYRKEWSGTAADPFALAVNSMYIYKWNGTDTCPASAP
jgi:hypothetical protein